MEEEDGERTFQEIDFCTLGMFIIDEIHYLPPKPPVFDILGGAGLYAALGARLFSPPPLSKTISWIVDRGSDFPSHLTTTVTSWSTSCLIRDDPTRLTTRGWNGYDTSDNRGFKYTTPKLRLEDKDLTPDLLFSKSFHLICSPTRCQTLVTSILRSRKHLDPTAAKPIFIWEPVPDLCLPSELLSLTNTLPYIDICSPNAHELASLLGDSEIDPDTGLISTKFIEGACEQLLSSMPLQSFALVVRCGAQGCFISKNGGRTKRTTAKKTRPKNYARGGLTLDMDMESLFAGLLDGEGCFELEEVDPGIELWLPAYFGASGVGVDNGGGKVVDPTGGGNGFMGGMAVALARGKGVEEASIWGSVAASFMIEQVGVPMLGVGGDGEEAWNGDLVERRLGCMMKACGR